MDAESYMEEIVGPTIGDFEANPASRRHAFLACVATFHCIDYLAHPKKSGNLRKEFGRNSSFLIVDRVAHAFKHVESAEPGASQNQRLEITSVFSRPPALAGRAQSGVSLAGDTVGGVVIWGKSGSDLLHTVKDAAKFLRNTMHPE